MSSVVFSILLYVSVVCLSCMFDRDYCCMFDPIVSIVVLYGRVSDSLLFSLYVCLYSCQWLLIICQYVYMSVLLYDPYVLLL